MKPVKIGLCGLGTVGRGTYSLLTRNAHSITARTGKDLQITLIGNRRPKPTDDTSDIRYTQDIFEVANDPEIDILVELIGGYDTARELILTAIKNGKHVVTANKALIAEYGNEIFSAARKQGVIVAYEAAVAGGIPVIKCLREGLAGNQVNWLAGIINGTGNYILTEMEDKTRPFDEVLSEAQSLGYAEADPTFDVDGIDACHKLTIMASIAFGIPLCFDRAYTESIRHITPADIQYANELGYRIKQLAFAEKTEQGIDIRVHPTLIPLNAPLANIGGVLNSVVINADAVNEIMLVGPGAGAEPTASSVVADIMDIAQSLESPQSTPNPLGFAADRLNETRILSMDEVISSHYLRIHAEDHPGVMNNITKILSNYGINIEAITQKAIRESDGMADIIILTQRIRELELTRAIKNIEALIDIQSPVTHIRVEAIS